MLTTEGWKFLTSVTGQQLIEAHWQEDPADLALRVDKNEIPVALVSTQIKYLQRARHKLPTFFQHRCIFLPKAYEQASSERAAALKPFSGDRILDLTCGLGVDVWHWSQSFRQVTALEPDPNLFRVVEHNFERMGLKNVRLLPQRAEDFLATYDGPPFDMIYADPDRRDADGQRQHDPRGGSPDLLTLGPRLRQLAAQIVIKLSPMFDLREAAAIFPDVQRLILLSIDGETRELLLQCAPGQGRQPPEVELWLDRQDRIWRLRLPAAVTSRPAWQVPPGPEAVRFLAEPDPAAYAAGDLAGLTLLPEFAGWRASHAHGYLWRDTPPDQPIPGRVLQVVAALPVQAKAVRRYAQTQGIDRLSLSRRHFPGSVADLRKKLRLADGGEWQGWATTFGRHTRLFVGKPLSSQHFPA